MIRPSFVIERDHICGLVNYVLEYYEALLRRMNRVLLDRAQRRDCSHNSMSTRFLHGSIICENTLCSLFLSSPCLTPQWNKIYYIMSQWSIVVLAFLSQMHLLLINVVDWNLSPSQSWMNLQDHIHTNIRLPASAHLLFGKAALNFYPPHLTIAGHLRSKGSALWGKKRPKFLTRQFAVHSVWG